MGRRARPGAEQPRPPRELSRAVRRLRWGGRTELWSAVPGSRRRDALASALQRLSRRFDVVRIPYGAIPAAEICVAVLAELDQPLEGEPQAALLQILATRQRRRVLLAIEEADHMPLAEAVRLRELVRRSDGALRLLLVTSGGPESERLGCALAASAAQSRAVQPTAEAAGSLPPLRIGVLPSPDRRASPCPEGTPLGAAQPFAPLRLLTHSAAQEALAAVEAELRRGQLVVALEGPPGMGKTLLLRMLAERVGDAYEPVWVPCMMLPGQELLRWILYCRRGRDVPSNAGAAWSQELEGACRGVHPLLLLLDDAGALTRDAACDLAQAVARGEGRLRIAMTVGDESGLPDPGALPTARRIRLAKPLADVDAAALLRTRFGDALDEGTIRRIVDEACGVPAALIRGANVRLARRGGLPARPDPPTGSAPREAR